MVKRLWLKPPCQLSSMGATARARGTHGNPWRVQEFLPAGGLGLARTPEGVQRGRRGVIRSRPYPFAKGLGVSPKLQAISY